MADSYKCGTCEHWGGIAMGSSTGKCYDRSSNPHYYNGDILSANDGCQSWKQSSFLARLERERKEEERKKREREEWLKTDEGQRWLAAEEERKEKEEREHQAWLKTPEGQKWQEAEKVKGKMKRIIMIVVRSIIIIFGAAVGTFLGLILVGFASDGAGYTILIIGAIIGLVFSVVLFFLCKHFCIGAGEGAVLGVKIGVIGYVVILIIVSIAFGQGGNFIVAALAGAIGGAVKGAVIGIIGGVYDYFDL